MEDRYHVRVRYTMSEKLHDKLKEYAEHEGLSVESCVKLFLWHQICFYNTEPERFQELWNNRKHFKGIKSYYIRIPLNFERKLKEVAKELNTRPSILNGKMAIMELDDILSHYACLDKETQKNKVTINLSDTVWGKMKSLAEDINVPMNAYISDVLLGYLIEYYPGFGEE